jgi:hypothetical protein
MFQKKYTGKPIDFMLRRSGSTVERNTMKHDDRIDVIKDGFVSAKIFNSYRMLRDYILNIKVTL